MRWHIKKMRDEGHWRAYVNNKMVSGRRHDTAGAARREAQWHVVSQFELKPGEERQTRDIARELNVPRYMIEEIPDMDERDGYHLHVGDGINGAAFERPRKHWTLFREA